MKIFAISVIKNESDIIGRNLTAAAIWADKVFVLDNGSTDGTWEIVQELAKVNDRIVPWKQDGKPFTMNIASELYYAFKHLATAGDWWCFRLDADEFYIDDPRELLSTISKWHQVVFSDSFQFNLTYEDIAEFKLEKRSDSDIDKIRYYQEKTWSEARFFRHRDALEWESELVIPKYAGVVSQKHIRLRHYQFRSVEQIQLRIKTRVQAVADDPVNWGHATGTELSHYLTHREGLLKYNGDKNWPTSGSFNQFYQHKLKRVVKLFLHRTHLLP